MNPLELTSLQHPIVKHFVKLRKSRAYRRECQTALIVGKKLISELSQHIPIKTLLVGKEAAPLAKAAKLFIVSPSILKKITDLENPEPYAAEIALPHPGNLSGKKFLLALDGVSDPGNLGTILRTALGLGWEGVFLISGSADPFNEKALRAAKGATFHLPLVEGSKEELDTLIQKNHLSVYLADMHGKPVEKQKIAPPLILILGNESHGIQTYPEKEVIPLALPMHPKMESLNVAVAGSILMYLLKRP